MFKPTFQFQFKTIKNNKSLFLFILFIAAIVIYTGLRHETLLQAVVYLLVMWLCFFITDLMMLRRLVNAEFPVKQPKRESIYFIVCFLLGNAFLLIRFSGLVNWEELKPLLRLATLPLLLFTFPIALAMIMLLLKYKPKEIGFRLQGLLIILPVIFVMAITNRLVAPGNLTWDAVMDESGSLINMIVSGFIVAGLSEEFFRVVGQTRLGALLRNMGWGWLITTVLWALMHAPKWYGEDKEVFETMLSVIRIVPIGLMWGYLTHRTKSILPSMIIHGCNFWGLQNF